eukprot:TRINITY_DN13137_c0_g1_i3.p1 TRINITY_DN13137_c0_g1~~TRINITY_DN13137_c0_g1_i3.p1  ORF type:complete len:356 (+),score=108.87 TRINITY_DN13137_c0_g1_i3:106-1173(+)
MGERKVLNKYYPPDFDPAKIPRRQQPKNLQMKVRMMPPMSIRCNTCGNYMYKGTKFNCRKEDVQGDTYLGLLLFRFYFKCTKCSTEMVMKTDPQNSDYVMESGASRNFEPWRAADEAKDAAKKEREEEERGDAMKALENRTIDSRQEMEILAALDEMKSMRERQAGLHPEDVLRVILQRRAAEEKAKQQEMLGKMEEEDEKLVQSVFRKPETIIRRLDDDDDDDDFDVANKGGRSAQTKEERFGECKQQGGGKENGTDKPKDDGEKRGSRIISAKGLAKRIPSAGGGSNPYEGMGLVRQEPEKVTGNGGRSDAIGVAGFTARPLNLAFSLKAKKRKVDFSAASESSRLNNNPPPD